MKPVPWFWLVRVILSMSIVVAWAATNPHTSVWQVVLVAFGVNLGIEGMAWAYRSEQNKIRSKQDQVASRQKQQS